MSPKAPRQVIREFSYVYAAVSPEQGLMTSLIALSQLTEDQARLRSMMFFPHFRMES